MCGFYFQVGEEKNRTTPQERINKIRHRGPDHQGIWESDSVYMGHNRLSIVDLSESGNQPFHNANHTIHLSCNGEIYNAPDLRSILESKGYHFISNSDNEVIVHGYEEWGVTIVDKLIGMFAFIIWDENKQQVFAARDHVGIKPLYYKYSNDIFRAGSELTAFKDSDSQWSPLAMAYYLSLGYVPSPYSWFGDCYKLEPGHYLTWNSNRGLRVNQYWQPPCDTNLDSQINDFPELFNNVLNEHLLSDVPVGVFLSGGLDSTSVCYGLQLLGYQTEALTIGFPNSPRDESKIAESTARHLGVKQRTIQMQPADAMELVKRCSEIYDEPQGYSALLTMYKVCEQASESYKVILSGDGGDEVFGGYNWYKDLGLNYSTSKRRFLFKKLYRFTGNPNFIKPNYFADSSDLHRHAWRLFPRFLPEQINKLLGDFKLDFNDEIMLAPLKKYWTNDLPLKRALQRVDLMTFCADSINPKVDRASMAHSMEVRVPFLDKRLIEYGLRLPVKKEFDDPQKGVLRNFLQGKVPKIVFELPKQGFSAPFLNNDHFQEMNKKLTWKVLKRPKYKLNHAQTWLLFNLNQFLLKE